MLKIKFILIMSVLCISTAGFAQTTANKANSKLGNEIDLQILNDNRRASAARLNPNVPQALQFQLLEAADDKPPYRLSALIQRSNCAKNCNPVDLYVDHTTILINEKGKAIRIYSLKQNQAYQIIRFRTQLQNPSRLEEVVFKGSSKSKK